MKKLSILGSTGSIGTQTLDIVKNNPHEFKIVGLTANKNIELLKNQINEFKPEAVAVMDNEKADLLKEDVDITVYSRIDGIIKIAALDETDTVVNSLVGSIGVKPTVEAIRNKKNIALANKETLVTAGSIVMEEVKKNDVNLMPIDSEHSAIFQCINGENINDINKIIITASGGPFRDYTKQQLENVSVDGALNHPTWNMGNKITIDSATLMNKGFEVIEAHWLYGIGYKDIEVVTHPQSIIHSLVEFKDNSTVAQLSLPDMKMPIQYALSYPKRFELNVKKLNLTEVKNLSFEKPNFELFPCLKYAYDAGNIGGTIPAVLNAVNEVAVYAFLDNKIKFLDIPRLIKTMIEKHNVIKNPVLNEILEIDKKIKEETQKIIESKIEITN
ncbi:MAG: 1-deoxy-D-xylulose-5-phosphate reductoisomerase [Candidatus Woesearchaeota archaeon]|jgi:1-deoxy-D-xylulose-5-phosphate reductoisomerase|nr:1-deoxy-D-xylulose-5-phosphate reductoisomerase [Candidatus Woesearchaeota archaeon]MDP6265273.1 1-deoxy-D-xylulose-5-phosphate reductoisomerase [Candidatus Woesearchaeota archaeon]MDP7322949.1 1-deoxy-D-xylulose-5-phosphate reductoisomerase [Candidatus Woesearchaeota archaeon]HJO01390.1 1-deoxy-D-xylulose-5-phosphate reductoisomerase [Candidatus Woesearchaeota archaeon]